MGVTTRAAFTAPLMPFFCFLDDVVFRGTADRSPGYCLRIVRIRPQSPDGPFPREAAGRPPGSSARPDLPELHVRVGVEPLAHPDRDIDPFVNEIDTPIGHDTLHP